MTARTEGGKPLVKVECARCLGGKGHISAFNHIQGGVCFQCGGKGYVMRKAAPRQMFWYRCWTVIDGEGGFYWSLRAPSEQQALTKTRKKIEKAIAAGVGYDPENYRVVLDPTR